MPSTVKSERKNYNFLSVDLALYVMIMIIGFLQLWILDVSKFNLTFFEWILDEYCIGMDANVSNYEDERNCRYFVAYEFVNFCG